MKRPPAASRGRTDWHQHICRNIEFAESVLREHGELVPMFVVEAGSETHIVGATFRNAEEKRSIFALVRLMCIALDATALTFITEAWMRRIRQYPGETEAAMQARIAAVPPSEAEDREEVIVVQTMYRDPETGERRAITGQRGIERDAAGKIVGLGAGDVEETGATGAAGEIFPAEAPTPDAQSYAQRVLAAVERLAQ